MDLKTQIEQFFNDFKDIMKIIAPTCAFIGLLGAGIIYVGSGWGPIARVKQNNPDLMNNLLLGMCIMLAAGTVSSFIVFA